MVSANSIRAVHALVDVVKVGAGVGVGWIETQGALVGQNGLRVLAEAIVGVAEVIVEVRRRAVVRCRLIVELCGQGVVLGLVG